MGVPFPKTCLPPSSAAKNDAIVQHVKKLAATISISNPSIMSTTEFEEVSDVEVSPSILFDSAIMNNIYKKFVHENNCSNDEINANTLRIVSNLIESLSTDDHIVYISTNFVDSLNQYNIAFISEFVSAVDRNPIILYDHFNMDIKEKLIAHSMYCLRMDKLFMNSYEDFKEERTNEIVNLIALSHLLMKIPEEIFHLLNILQVKYLIHINILTDENKPAYIYYIQSLTNLVLRAMKHHRRRGHTMKLYNTGTLPDWLCRDNYRQLKKWNVLISSIQRGMAKPLDSLKKQIQDSKQLHYDDIVSEEVERSRLIRILKKGYRFKNSNETQLFNAN